jgi:hypothetical protein
MVKTKRLGGFGIDDSAARWQVPHGCSSGVLHYAHDSLNQEHDAE